MKKRSLFDIILTSIVCLIPLLIGLALYSKLPDQIAVHWDWGGNADGYRPRAFAVFGLPLILLGMNMLVHFMLAFDPKRGNISPFTARMIVWLVPVLSLVLNGITLFSALGISISVRIVVPFIVGAIFLVCGIMLPRCKQNYTMGIKLPWTLSSEENWNRTHRMAGPLWIAGGILYMVFSLSTLWWIGIIIIALITIVPSVYSFVLYRKGI